MGDFFLNGDFEGIMDFAGFGFEQTPDSAALANIGFVATRGITTNEPMRDATPARIVDKPFEGKGKEKMVYDIPDAEVDTDMYQL